VSGEWPVAGGEPATRPRPAASERRGVARFPFAAIKVGGSLLDWREFPERLMLFLDHLRSAAPDSKSVLIAGGGPAADLIRALDRIHRLGDAAAHDLALHALDLTGRVLERLMPGSLVVERAERIDAAWNAGLLPILAPGQILEEIAQSGADPLPASWDVTSDTIAARIAAQLGAERLILLKSAPLPGGATWQEAARLGRVDPMFPEAAQALARVEYVNLRQWP
jgi:5-(aminomethyl)-3-furanmethanol phosphate kinase